MPDTVRTTLALDADAAALLNDLAPSPRKKGELLSELIRAAAARRLADDVPGQLGAVLARVAALEARVVSLESRAGVGGLITHDA
jgi:hypothetical protein